MANFRLLAGVGISAAVLAFSISAPAQAVSMQGSSTDTCSDYATIAANNWGRGYIQPAGDFQQSSSGTVLVIAAGKKFLVPPHQDVRELAPVPVGQRIAQYNTVQVEEFNHCMFGLPVNAATLK